MATRDLKAHRLRALDRKLLRFLDELTKEHHSPPDELFHYTNGDALLSILEHSTLRATAIRYMNDASELDHGSDVIRSVLEPKIMKAHGLEHELLERTNFRLWDTINKTQFVACFCENSDLLSQWRAYGANGSGYAIGFSSKHMRDPDLPGLRLRRVIYDGRQQRRLVAAVIKRVTATLKESGSEDDDILDKISRFAADLLHDCMAVFKHPAFAEEKEWRLVVWQRLDSPTNPRLKFRATRSFLVPYVDLHLRASGSHAKLPIETVVLGPRLHKRLSDAAVLAAQDRFGYGSGVSISDTPLRGVSENADWPESE